MNGIVSVLVGLLFAASSLQSFAVKELPVYHKVDTNFLEVCTKVTINEKMFTGECRLYPPSVFDENLKVYIDIVNTSDSSMTIDRLFREKLLLDSTKFFRANYSEEYVKNLDDFEAKLSNLGDKLLKSTESVTILDFLNAYKGNIVNFIHLFFIT